MRIIAGKYRGRTLAQFSGFDVRPTPDRVKESLFQILTPRLAGARVLDLFCGSGALGLESLSRGAEEVVFNDSSKESLALLKKNLTALKESGAVYNLDYKACLGRLDGQFDLIFCDPPYAEDCVEAVLTMVKKQKLLKENGTVVYESEREQPEVEGWVRADERRYGRTRVVLWRQN